MFVSRSNARIRRIVLLVACALALLSSQAHAIPSTDFSYFGPTATVLDFSEIAMSQSTVITNQYAGYGVTFSPNVWFENHRAPLGWDTHNIANFLTGTTTSNPTIDMIFSGQVDGAAFEFAGNNNNSFTIEAVLGGSVVESYTHNQTACCAPVVVGFQNIQFDTLRITHASGASPFFIADRLTYNTPVPEPNTALLVGMGLALLPRRKR